TWLWHFTLPSIAAIGLTYLVLRLTQRAQLRKPLETVITLQPLSSGARLTAFGILLTGIVLISASALGVQLGLPTFCAGLATAVLIHLRQRLSPLPVLKGVSWGVLPLVAGLFVLVEGLALTGVINDLAHGLQALAERSSTQATWGAGVVVAI